MPISVVIQTYNAQKYLQQVLNSVKGFDEVVLCDMESTDDTVSIAESAGCKVVTFPKGNYNICEPARDFAIHSATHEWVLVVDADEFVTPELKDYLYKYIEEPEHDALYVHRKNMFLGKWIKASYPDSQLRFMRQKKATWPPTIHSVPTIDGTVGQMPKDPKYALVHAGVTVKGQIQKMNDYTENDGRTVWFNSRYYRANILWQGDRMNIRDMHLFDEKKESYYYKNVCTSNQCVYMTLPIVDGCLWSTNELMAGLRLYGKTASGMMTELRGGEPVVRQSGKGIVVTWPMKSRKAVFTLKMTEKSFSISCSDKTLDWCAQLDVQPEAQLPFKEIASNMLSASQDGFDYQMALRRGRFDTSLTAAGIGFRIIPEKSKIEIKTR